MSYPMSDAERRVFLMHGTHTAKVATTRADGRPHVAPVWFVLDDDDVIFTTGAGTVKGKTLQRDPRVSVVVDQETEPFAFVVIDGIAEVSFDHDDLLHWATALGARYMGADRAEEFGRRNAAPSELLVRVRPSRIVAIGGMTD
jgi:PPOX class probable F420-dependent enzyme